MGGFLFAVPSSTNEYGGLESQEWRIRGIGFLEKSLTLQADLNGRNGKTGEWGTGELLEQKYHYGSLRNGINGRKSTGTEIIKRKVE